MNNRKITYAALHTPLFVPGYGSLGDKLNAVGDAVHPAVEMSYDGELIRVGIKAKNNPSKVCEVWVPISSVAYLVLAPETTTFVTPTLATPVGKASQK